MSEGVTESERPVAAGLRPGRWWVLGLAIVGVGVALALLYFQRPQGQFFYPRCTFYATTGLLCPGCGGLRATHELLHGRWLEAARSNALMVVGGPLAVAGWLLARGRAGGRGGGVSARGVWVVAAVTLAFTVLRNLPWEPAARWLAP
jgi:hypothetical protein